MSNVWVHLLLALLTIWSASCSKSTAKAKTEPISTQETRDTLEGDKTQELLSIMNECNETFRTEMSYIEALNKSGSFPDESDRTPKCFVRCILERNSVMSEDGEVNLDRAAAFFVLERDGATEDRFKNSTQFCSNRDETCMCERSYQFVKCVVEMELSKDDIF